MKTYACLFVTLSLLTGLSACKEPTIDEGILPFVTPTSTDSTGGTWRTVLLTSAAEIAVPQPAATTSDAYQSELTAVKNGLLSATPEQNTAVNYWAAGSVQRWNQIARLLVSKYNVDAAYDETTGQYAPYDATKPVASAPYAARLYALLSVAQYDALVVSWRAKFRYNRPSLERQGILARVPILDVPSYPSEDAAVAEASCQVLAYFFPAETAWLKAKAAEHKQSRVWAGACVPSDLKAGEELAAAVATKAIAYARSDRFDRARDPSNTWESLRSRAPYDLTWKSLDIPARSPMLPLAGTTRTWFDSTAIVRALPAAPPATTTPAFQQALADVRDLANTRTRDQWRIAEFWSDGSGTYTTPGHWNRIAEDLVRQYGQNELRSARTYALMNRAMQDGATGGWQTSFTYFVPRPSQVDPTIKTAVRIPNMPGYPSTHALLANAATTVLVYLFPNEAEVLKAQAAEATLSQLYGGVQYRFDIDAGARSGAAVGQLAVGWASADGAR